MARTYRLASNLAADVSSALVSRPYLSSIHPLIQKLADETTFPCVLTEPIGDGSFLTVLTVNHADPFVFNIPVGFRFPAGSPPHMKAALAWLPTDAREVELQKWKPVRYTRSTITTVEAMREELLATRARGYARSAGEFTEGFITILLPIFDRGGNVFMILQAAGTTELLNPREAEIGGALQRSVSRIHRAIDGRPPVDFPTIAGD
jgi:DNA-binding IclR family transcriptional regulator